MTFPQTIHFAVAELVRFLSPTGLAIEWVLVALSFVFVLKVPTAFASPFSPLCRLLHWVVRRPGTAILTCLALPVLLRLVLLPVSPVPEPSIHDEFSHLLLADTLAHGRLTNPTPAMWRHFESIHVIQRPTYNSMYLPAQGLALAVGQVFFRTPWAGVELSIALMCGAMYWMFLGWMSRAWAFFGVLLAMLKLTLVGFWVNSYMGGSVPAIGGALVVGSLPRLRGENPRPIHSFLLGLGAVILMNSRPFEGGLLTLLVVAFTLPALRARVRAEPARVLRRLALPAAAVVLIGALCLGYYCRRVTGRVTRMPYVVNRATYGWPENLAFLPPIKVELQDPVLRRMYELEVAHHGIYKGAPVLIHNLVTRLFDNWAYLIGPILTIPLLIPLLWGDRKSRIIVFLLLAIALLNLAQMVLYPYHLAPVVPILFCLVALGTQTIYKWLSRLAPGRATCFAVVLPLCIVGADAMNQFGDQLEIQPSSYWERGYEWHRDARASIVQWLLKRPGKHLVIVRYESDHPVNQEWVYNGAEPDASRIVWARELEPAANRRLLDYYKDRHAWLVEADSSPQHVVPYKPEDETEQQVRCSPCSANPRKTH
jgi:hypothetical protein